MTKHYSLGGKKFPTKKSVKDWCREILHRSTPHFPLPSDYDFLWDLLAMHPRAKDKIGCGVQSFMVRFDPVWRTSRHFQLLRLDGTTTDFSFHTCLDGESPKADAIAALRHATSSQIVEFKREAFSGSDQIRCPISDDLLSFGSCHVDHEFPTTFSAIAAAWLKYLGIELEQVVLKPSTDNQWACEMADEGQIRSWLEFHKEIACLRVVSPRVNMEMQKIQMGSK